jgi:hypothetical protein
MTKQRRGGFRQTFGILFDLLGLRSEEIVEKEDKQN